ncbi:MAG: glycosyltransferase family 4 protein [Hyphomonadaceae bacterium]
MPLDPLFVALLAALVSAIMAPVVIAAGVPDAPDQQRKAHQAVTPTCGGLAIAAGFALSLAVMCLLPAARWEDQLNVDMVARLGVAAALAFAALAVGFVDDVRPLGARLKFAVIAALSVVAALFVAHTEALPLAGEATVRLGFAVGVLGSALWVFTLVNATNFVDGANGLSMGSLAIGLGGLAWVSYAAGAPHAAILALAGVGGAIGFLLWNFPRGLVFAGDAGALFMGTLAACAALVAVMDGGVSPFIPPVLFFPILADVLLTLAWRLKRGRPLLAAHRDHLFQIGLRAGLGHARVTLLFWAATAVSACIGVWADGAQRAGGVPLAGDEAGVALAWLDSAAPALALMGLALGSIALAIRLRAYARGHGLDLD